MQKYLIFMAFAAILTLAACYRPAPVSVRNMYVSANAHSLIDSYRDLVTKTGIKGDNYTNIRKDTTGDYYCTHAAMSAKGFNKGLYGDKSDRQVYGVVTFVSRYWYQHNTIPEELTWFYTIWVPRHGPGYAGFGDVSTISPVCAPDTIIYPFYPFNTSKIVRVMLVPISAYQTSSERGKPLLGDKILYKLYGNIAIKPNDIKSINDVYIEFENEYFAKNETERYNDLNSSKGIVCEVTLKNGKTELCYILNDYDGGGTLRWKEKK